MEDNSLAMPSIRPLLFPPIAFALSLATGCGEAKVTSYRAPKDTFPAAPSTATTATSSLPADHPPIAATPPATGATMATTAVPTAGGDDLKWTAPAGWQLAPANAMRKATYTIVGDGAAKAELSITAFPGDVGGEAANLSRWRGQVGLPEATAAEIVQAVTRFESGGLKFTVADFTNDKATPPSRLLGAIVPAGANTWFFKLTGPAALLEREKPIFLAFLKSVKAP